MTAEIGVLNMRGVALSADSAVTIGNAKVMNNAKKLFTLDSQHSIGIMIYGNANIMSIPWEVIITLFRKDIGNQTLNKLDDYEQRFFSFIQKLDVLKNQEQGVLSNYHNKDRFVYNYGRDMLQIIKQEFRESRTGEDEVALATRAINKININTDKINDNLKEIRFDFFTNEYKDAITDLLRKEGIGALQQDVIIDLFSKKLFALLMSDNYYSTSQTGIVFAGYGSDDLFPGIQQFSVDGFVCNKLKYAQQQEDIVGENMTSAIEPFAQQEMVHTVLKGIDPRLDQARRMQLIEMQNTIINKLGLTGDQAKAVGEIVKSNNDYFQNMQRADYVNPMLGMLDMLSIEELATMAKTLVSLTSFKRKFSGSMETVGGPIDVLVISKGEGPIWIDRKKYFDIDMNQGYLNRRR